MMKTSGHGGFQSHVYYWRAECWASGSAFANNMVLSIFILDFSSSNSHPKFLPTHPKNQAFIGISAKKYVSNFNYFHILSRWSSIGFKLPIAFPLAPTAVELGTSFPGQERRGRWTTWPIEASATCVVSWCVKRIGTKLGENNRQYQEVSSFCQNRIPCFFKSYLSTTFQWWCSISESNMAVSFTMKHHQNKHASEFALQSKMDDFQNIREIHQNLNLSVEPGKCHRLMSHQGTQKRQRVRLRICQDFLGGTIILLANGLDVRNRSCLSSHGISTK